VKSFQQFSLAALALASGIASAAPQPFFATNAVVSVDQSFIATSGLIASALGSATYNAATGTLTDPVASIDLPTSPGALVVNFASGAGIRIAQNAFVGANLTNFSFNLADNTLYGDIAALGITNQALLTAGTISSTFGNAQQNSLGTAVFSSTDARGLNLLASNFRLADDFVEKLGGPAAAASFQFVASVIKEVKVSSVPEPSAYGLLAACLAGAGLVARRRNAANS